MVERVETLWLDIARYQPLRGGSYTSLPEAVKNKKAVVNVEKKRLATVCGELYDLLSSPRHIMQRGQRMRASISQGSTPYTNLSDSDDRKAENNQAVNVFGWDKGIIVHRLNKHPADMRRINLLLIEKAGKFHCSVQVDQRPSTG